MARDSAPGSELRLLPDGVSGEAAVLHKEGGTGEAGVGGSLGQEAGGDKGRASGARAAVAAAVAAASADASPAPSV